VNGFGRVIRIGLVFVACSLGAVAWGQQRPWANKVPKEQVHAPNPVPASPAAITAGQSIYTNTCLPCHGELGQGDGPAAQFIKPPPKPLVVNNALPLPDGVMFWVITNGIEDTGMSSFSETLSATERWQAILYLHSLSTGGASATASAATPAPPATAASSPAPVASATPGAKQ